ncbi:hypothetical protein O4J56_05385 [Nocardiopsis sp. RSe5-2]|uniref:Secreted protein n=1 Tax=Nocardiopsis endophytica TaxID=3018445 RepID=A0ABT4U0N2_9ACTN|nr:hypothetical protein [Nocardiopsis endophytica]MDA2810064.1 hypothetical protein [Nocardiopsis endophytica]
MSRISPRPVAVVLGTLALTGLAASPAAAAEGALDGTISAEGQSCSWTDGVTSDQAPNALTVDRTTINPSGTGNLSCDGDTTATLNNDPNVTFDDAAGTLTVDVLDISVSVLGVTCRYEGAGVSAQRDGDTRTYTTSTEIPLAEGGFLCPDPASVTASLTFR